MKNKVEDSFNNTRSIYSHTWINAVKEENGESMV